MEFSEGDRSRHLCRTERKYLFVSILPAVTCVTDFIDFSRTLFFHVFQEHKN